jgi:predicted component of type VI protein secretion system
MILAIAAPGMGVTDLIERVRMLVKLSPPDEINNLISHALPALKLVHASPPPAAVPNRSDFQYFTVNQAGRLWDGIQRSRSLSLYVPLDLPGARPEIYIVLP